MELLRKQRLRRKRAGVTTFGGADGASLREQAIAELGPPPREPRDYAHRFELSIDEVVACIRSRSHSILPIVLTFAQMRNGDFTFEAPLDCVLVCGGSNALHVAAHYLDERAVHIVMNAAGESWRGLVRARNEHGQTPLDMAEEEAAWCGGA